MRYVKPKYEYWSSKELDLIEAKMSGGTGVVIEPAVVIEDAEYDGEYVTVNYRITQNNGGNWQIGYEYPIAEDYEFFGIGNPDWGEFVESTVGTYTRRMRVPNYNCEVRLCIRLVLDHNIVGMSYETEYIFLMLPTEHQYYAYTVDKIIGIIWEVYNYSIDIVLKQRDDKLMDLITSLLEWGGHYIIYTVLKMPEVKGGQHYRFHSWYQNIFFFMEIQMWESEQDYLDGEPPAYEERVQVRVPWF